MQSRVAFSSLVLLSVVTFTVWGLGGGLTAGRSSASGGSAGGEASVTSYLSGGSSSGGGVQNIPTSSGSSSSGSSGGNGTFDYFEQDRLIRSSEVIQPLGPNLMGDEVSEFNGVLSFTQEDVSLPGNSAIPVAVGRHLVTGVPQPAMAEGLFGDWDLEIPHLQTLAAGVVTGSPNWYGMDADGSTNNNRCSELSAAPPMAGISGGSPVLLQSSWWWDGYHIDVPGAGTQTLLSRPASPGSPPYNYETAQPSTGGPYPVLTKEHWDFSCINLASGGSGEGFLAHAPDGTTYQFDRMVKRSYAGSVGQVVAARSEIWILPSQVTDRFGNTVTYTYGSTDPWQVLSIKSSDGREITFAYYSGTHRVYQVSDQTRTWTYLYGSSGTLQSVTLPDGSSWQFVLTQLEPTYVREKQDPTCYPGIITSQTDPTTYFGTITHPSGAVGTFYYHDQWHGRTNTPGPTTHCAGYDPMPTYYSNYSLTKKELIGPQMSDMIWTYSYSAADGGWGTCYPSCGGNGTKTVTIIDPLNNQTVNTYGTVYYLNEGLLLDSTVSTYGVSGSTVRDTSYAYASSASPPAGAPYTSAYPPTAGYSAPMPDWSAISFTPQYQQTVSQQGATFTQTITAFDDLARATALTRSSSLGYSRNESTVYFDQTSLWVLGQVESETIAGLTASSTTYTALAQPQATYAFGKFEYQYTYNTDGTLATRTDGLSHTTTLSNYMRGLPQAIQYADGKTVSAVVNNIGTINSATNEAGTTWDYTYDAMGRLKSATPPQGDPVVYNTENLTFVPVSTSEYGIPAGHWRQTITTGTGTAINYFDGRFRKILTYTADTANPGATGRFQSFDYDAYNRVTFTSYPVRSINTITDITLGHHTTYDALGRVTVTTQDSELGTLTTTTQYLASPAPFQTQFTDALGNITTSSYQAFDDPDEAKLSSSSLPEGVSLAIQRDVFGKALSITRSGTYNGSGISATRSYVYDANQLLCKTVEPETGATIQTLDAANNVTWKAAGQSYTSTSTCDQASVLAAAQVALAYDQRNRVTGITYGDGSPAVSRTYTADGKPASVTADGSIWTYTYNNRRLLSQEKLLYQSTNLTIKHGFDANGHAASLTYPDSTATTVAYNPNALGEPTTVGSAATGVSYAPDGSVAGFTYGNGIVHSETENERDLPYQNTDAGVLSLQYTYDKRGSLTAITDSLGGNGARAFGYDGLGRLTTAGAHDIWGDGGGYTYDPLDNVRTSLHGTHNYNAATNQLTSIVNSSGTTSYSFDVRGNLSARGSQQFQFDLGNRIVSAPGVDSFHYDGWFRRTNVTQSNGTNQVWVYSQAGQLLYLAQSGGTGGLQTVDYLYLGHRLVAQSGSAGTSYLHTDIQGSPEKTTNSARTLVSSTSYEPYGNTAAGTVPTTVGYTGHVNDPELGLVYMQARYYDPIAARFLSVDPVVTDTANGGGFGRYAYVGDDPVGKIDPTGEDDKCFQACGGAQRKTIVHISGTPQTTGTPGHAETSKSIAEAKAAKPGTARVHLNQTLRTISDGKIDSSLRPDVATVRTDGKIDIDEVLSKTQFDTAAQVEAKYREALPADMRGEVTSSRPSTSVKGLGILGVAAGVVNALTELHNNPNMSGIEFMYRAGGVYEIGVITGVIPPPPPQL